MNSQEDTESIHALELTDLTGAIETAMLKSSQAMHAYMLDSESRENLQNLRAARNIFSVAAQRLSILSKGFPDLAGQIRAVNEFEIVNIRKLEDEVVALASARNPRGLELFLKSYRALRMTQAGKFTRLNRLAQARSEQILTAAQAKHERSALWSALTLIACTLIGFAVMYRAILSTICVIRGISGALNDSSAALRRAAEEVSASSGTLSQSTSEQAASLEETAAAVVEMSSMITKNSQNAKGTAAFATLSQTRAQEGQEAVTRMVHSMDDISQSHLLIMEQVNESNRQMCEIVKVIQQIGDKTKVINDIVFQTKLLSFNAAGEAARAGEHGKGFAVVAEEVGNLAQMSGNAAKEISEMLLSSIQKVEGIVDETRVKVEGLIAQGKVKVDSGVNVARQCGELLGDIVENVSNVSSMAAEISSASQEQSQGVIEINKAIGQLDQVTQQNAATSEQTARAADELSTQSQALRASIQRLVSAIEGAVDPSPDISPAIPEAPPRMARAQNVVPLKPTAKKAKLAIKPEAQKAASGGGVPDRDHDGFEDV
jgi:methyl-accepting chemotaxis protein